MSIHVSDFGTSSASILDIEGLLAAGGFDIARLLQVAEQHLDDGQTNAREHISRARALLDTRSQAPATGGLAPWQMKRLERHIEREMEHGISLTDLAELVGLTPGYFCKAFRKSFGTSPISYVQAGRVARAKDLMLNSDRPLAEIALDCGLCDQAHFSRIFRKSTGMSPSQWRKTFRADKA